jgi:acetylornithine deacetylase/succinyl-diaminopimelate desuccinylase-like protein
MKSQAAAENVAVSTLASSGWRPARGTLKHMTVVDEEVGGHLGARSLTEQRPDASRVDWLVNEGGGQVMP